jgi:hypothetical protein
MKHYTEVTLKAALDQAVSSTETMNALDVDPDIIKARLKLLRELADGFGVTVEIPSNRIIMIKRIIGEVG